MSDRPRRTKGAEAADAPPAESKPDRPQVPAPEGELDLAYWPEVPEDSRPRKVVFDTLRATDVSALTARGYEPVLLRLLPRRNAAEDDAFFIALMQGVSEGTVLMSKGRSEGLAAELRSRQYGAKKELKRKSGVVDKTSLAGILSWADSRHTFGKATTMLTPEDVAEYERTVLAARRAAEQPGKKRRN